MLILGLVKNRAAISYNPYWLSYPSLNVIVDISFSTAPNNVNLGHIAKVLKSIQRACSKYSPMMVRITSAYVESNRIVTHIVRKPAEIFVDVMIVQHLDHAIRNTGSRMKLCD